MFKINRILRLFWLKCLRTYLIIINNFKSLKTQNRAEF